MASLMVWIVAGTDLLGTVLGAIPGGPGVWIASTGEIAAVLGPPYQPSLLAALPALIALRYVGDRHDGASADTDWNSQGDR